MPGKYTFSYEQDGRRIYVRAEHAERLGAWAVTVKIDDRLQEIVNTDDPWEEARSHVDEFIASLEEHAA